MKDNFKRELQNNLAHTLLIFVNLRCRHFTILRCNNFQSRCDAHACEDTMHVLVRYGAHDAR
jgi:hypothetical protein